MLPRFLKRFTLSTLHHNVFHDIIEYLTRTFHEPSYSSSPSDHATLPVRVKNQFASGCSMAWRLILLCLLCSRGKYSFNKIIGKFFFFCLNLFEVGYLDVFICMFLFHTLRGRLLLFSCLYRDRGIFDVC